MPYTTTRGGSAIGKFMRQMTAWNSSTGISHNIVATAVMSHHSVGSRSQTTPQTTDANGTPLFIEGVSLPEDGHVAK